MIFLFNFEIVETGIDFKLNEGLAKDMYSDLDIPIKKLVENVAQLLMEYRHVSINTTILTTRILDTNELEIMFSTGLGKHIPDAEKNIIYDSCKLISELLVKVMQRRHNVKN